MKEKKFAFESEAVSVAFFLDYGLGDCIIAKKVFDALVEVEKNCYIDIFCETKAHEDFAKAFYGQSKNLNLILSREIHMQQVEKYDLALFVRAALAVSLERVNLQRLQAISPNLLQILARIDDYNNQNVKIVAPWGTALLSRNILLSRIFKKNCYWFLACGGALPIRDDNVNIPLLPEYKNRFKKLKLGRYITFYANAEYDKIPKNKVWPVSYLREWISLVRKRFPSIEIVQCGGGGISRLRTPTAIFSVVI